MGIWWRKIKREYNSDSLCLNAKIMSYFEKLYYSFLNCFLSLLQLFLPVFWQIYDTKHHPKPICIPSLITFGNKYHNYVRKSFKSSKACLFSLAMVFFLHHLYLTTPPPKGIRCI